MKTVIHPNTVSENPTVHACRPLCTNAALAILVRSTARAMPTSEPSHDAGRDLSAEDVPERRRSRGVMSQSLLSGNESSLVVKDLRLHMGWIGGKLY
jgi:hypothetical protein